MCDVTVKIIPADKGTPVGQLATAELHFEDGPLAGLKLIGFGVWERRGGSGRNVTFPARQYTVNGERRSFAVLRPITDVGAQESVRGLVLAAYAEFEQGACEFTRLDDSEWQCGTHDVVMVQTQEPVSCSKGRAR